MKIRSLKIEKLFELFNYDISFQKNENILIITGPNGFGKTMVLNIIFNLFDRNFLFFYKLVFHKIIFFLDENIEIAILKISENDKSEIKFIFSKDSAKIGEVNLDDMYNIQAVLPFLKRTTSNQWFDFRNRKFFYSIKDVLREYGDGLSPEILKNNFSVFPKEIDEILDLIGVYFIREQRLFQKANRSRSERNYRIEAEEEIIIDTIQTYAKKLKESILEYSQKSFLKTQELDSSYPKRLITEKNSFTQEEYEEQYKNLKSRLDKLKEFGLYDDRKQDVLEYNEADKKALSVYLKDFESKLSVFHELVEKLELFTDILNKHRFIYKSIKISPINGFSFETTQGEPLELGQLSSGEQHEVILLYELIFNAKPNNLVLIDEPEISLHVVWQKEFLTDLLQIVKIQRIQVLIATHSPYIINEQWDLVYNLQEQHLK